MNTPKRIIPLNRPLFSQDFMPLNRPLGIADLGPLGIADLKKTREKFLARHKDGKHEQSQ